MEDLEYDLNMCFCNKESIRMYVGGGEDVEFHNLSKLIRGAYVEREEEP
jgi:hypothetical protein